MWQSFVLVQSQFLVTWWEAASAELDERKEKKLHLHYSVLTSRLISAQGHQYFWHFSGGINIEWMSLCCAQGGVCLQASTKITWICLLACSVSWRDCRWSLRSLSLFNIMHHKQYPIWTIELWKYTAQARGGRWQEMQPAVWVMGISTGLGWNNLWWDVIFLLVRRGKTLMFQSKENK